MWLVECAVHCPFYGTHDRLYTSLRHRAQLKRLQEIRLVRVLSEHLRSEPVENVAECGRANTALWFDEWSQAGDAAHSRRLGGVGRDAGGMRRKKLEEPWGP